MELQDKNINPEVESTEAPADAVQAVTPADDAAQTTKEDELEAEASQLPDEAAAADTLEAVEEPQPMTKESLIVKLEKLVENDAPDITSDELAHLKQQFYHLKNAEPREEGAQPVADPLEDRFKELMAALKEKKAEQRRQLEAQQQANLERKRAIIAQLVDMGGDTDNVNRHFAQARELQAEFLAIGDVPDTEATAVWKEYTDAREKFYDQLKINKELRDYDFKKNLAEKELICAEAAKLIDEEDVITAFRRLQDLHDKWRRIGPVAKELREEIWTRFKDASAEINKRYQAHFEERKAREAENEAAKTALCEEIEALEWADTKTFAAWDAMTKEIMDMQARWKTIGFASRKSNNALFARFRSMCDKFFAAKADFYKSMKENQAQNLARKTALCEQAEALRESTDWRATTETLVNLQKEWKTIGAVPKKYSDPLWARFLAACDYFFEQKKANTSGVRHTEQANLKLKQEIIDRLAAMTAPDAPVLDRAEARKQLDDLRTQWNEIGHVPFKMKDKIYDTYRQLLRDADAKFDLRRNRERREAFANAVDQMEGDNNKLMRERERVVRALEQRRSDLHTYENNLGFLSFKAGKGENPLMREMQRRVQGIKDDIARLQEQITLLDSKL